jgi:IMP cyclohydrolase
MYVGRLLVAKPGLGAYRVSSRSFPNRRVVARDGVLTVAPTPDAPETDNPYVAYNCVRPAGPGVALGNGSHVDPIAEKVDRGYPARDALVTALHALDFEKDDYDTPRIAAVVGPDAAHVGIVRRDALLVEAVDGPTLVATYEEDHPRAFDFPAADPETAARDAYHLDYEHPICAAAARVDADGVETARYNGPDGEG